MRRRSEPSLTGKPRIPYVADADAGPPELVREIRARRGGVLLNLDRMLLHSPALAKGWNAHLGAVRGALTIEPKLRELAICAVAALTGADYEWDQHLPLFIQAGATDAAAEALRDVETASADPVLFDVRERAVLHLAIEMTRAVTVSEAAFEDVRMQLGGDRQVVELVSIIATYNMVSRFLVALGVDAEGEDGAG